MCQILVKTRTHAEYRLQAREYKSHATVSYSNNNINDKELWLFTNKALAKRGTFSRLEMYTLG